MSDRTEPTPVFGMPQVNEAEAIQKAKRLLQEVESKLPRRHRSQERPHAPQSTNAQAIQGDAMSGEAFIRGTTSVYATYATAFGEITDPMVVHELVRRDCEAAALNQDLKIARNEVERLRELLYQQREAAAVHARDIIGAFGIGLAAAAAAAFAVCAYLALVD